MGTYLLNILGEGKNPRITHFMYEPKEISQACRKETFFPDLEEKCLKMSNIFLKLSTPAKF